VKSEDNGNQSESIDAEDKEEIQLNWYRLEVKYNRWSIGVSQKAFSPFDRYLSRSGEEWILKPAYQDYSFLAE
jgi:hypothetical protein